MSILTVTFNPLDLQLLGSPSVESAVSTTFLYFQLCVILVYSVMLLLNINTIVSAFIFTFGDSALTVALVDVLQANVRVFPILYQSRQSIFCYYHTAT